MYHHSQSYTRAIAFYINSLGVDLGMASGCSNNRVLHGYCPLHSSNLGNALIKISILLIIVFFFVFFFFEPGPGGGVG